MFYSGGEAVYSSGRFHPEPERTMLKTISKIGNSQGLIFDAALLDLAGLKLGDQVNVTVAPGGTVMITPIRSAPPMAAVQNVIQEAAADYRATLKKLA